MNPIDRIISPNAFRVSTAVTVIIAGWFALTFVATLGALVAGA